MSAPPPNSQRRLLAAALGAAAGLARPAASGPQPPPLWVRNAHTGEQALVPQFIGADRDPLDYPVLDYLLRDHRAGAVAAMDRKLYDFLYLVSRVAGGLPRIAVVSGYRSPRTNAALHVRSEAVAVRSNHLQGRAVDFRVEGLPTTAVARVAWHLSLGGVGLYGDGFTHCDTGPVRRWGDPF